MMLTAQTGMGLYPGDPCYQANRDRWVPYWMDTNGEYRCLISGKTFPLAPPPPPAAPQTEEAMSRWTPDDVYTAQQAQWEEWKRVNRELAVGEEGGSPPPPDTLKDWFGRNKWYLMAAGLGLVAVMQVTRR